MHVLNSFATLRISGSDAHTFLQGQLSNDMQLLSKHQSLLTSCNSAQGRVQVVLTLIEREDGIVAVLPAALLGTTLTRLRKYVLRSKVLVEDASDRLQLLVATRAELHAQQLPEPAEPGAHREQHGISVLRWHDPVERFLVLRPGTRIATTNHSNTQQPTADQEWLLADIRAGVPHVLPETYESFVAQMLNLDVLNAVSFNKGCYTGQEIIARAHFRGAVKRRMFHLQGTCPPPAAGSKILNDVTHAGEVVMAASTQDGCELLAVLNLSQRHTALHLENAPDVMLAMLSLPYIIPMETGA